jgi:CheY-like chemotaxis protein
MQLEYLIYMELAVIPMDILICYYVFKNYTSDTPAYRAFRRLAVVLTITCAFDVATAVVSSLGTVVSEGCHMLFNTGDSVFAGLSSLLFIKYAISVSNKKFKNEWYRMISFVPTIIGTVMLTANLIFPGFLFCYSEQGEYVHGPYFVITAYIIPLINVLIGILFLTGSRKMTAKNLAAGILGGSFSVAIIIIQMLYFDYVLITFYVASICLLGMMTVVETPDYRKLVKTLKELEEAKKDADRLKKRAQADNQAKTELLVQVSHELRTPINGILGYNNIIMEDAQDSTIKEYCQKIDDSGKHLLNVFDEMLSISAEEGRLEGFSADEITGIEPGLIDKNSKTIKVLAVDDNEINLELLVRALTDAGITVDTAENGLEAVEKAEKTHYDMILMDHMMPVMDGIEAMHMIRRIEKYKTTPIIVITANAVGGQRDKYMKEGFDAYLTKPLDRKALFDAMYRFTGFKERNRQEELISMLTFLNTSRGLEYSGGDADFYIEQLKLFTTDNLEDKIRDDLEADDLGSYAMNAGTIAATARMIGADELSDIAGMASSAAAKGNREALNKLSNELTVYYRFMMERLYGLLSDRVAIPEKE